MFINLLDFVFCSVCFFFAVIYDGLLLLAYCLKILQFDR